MTRGAAIPLIAVLVLLVAAAPAHARTLTGIVIAPAADARGPGAILPVLRTNGASARPIVAARVRGRRPVRQGSDRFSLDDLRPGDRLTLRVRGRRAVTVTLRRSGRADAFARVAGALRRTARGGRRALDAIAPIAAGQAADVGRARDRLTTLDARLQAYATDVGTSLRRLRAVRPARGPRRAAVVAVQQPYAARLAATREGAATVAELVRAAARALARDGTGGGSGDDATPGEPAPAPATVGEVSRLSTALVAFVEDAEAGLLAPLA